jgi:hypothetical protein
MFDNHFRRIELVKPGIQISIFWECHRPAALIPDVDFLFFLFYSLSVLTGEVFQAFRANYRLSLFSFHLCKVNVNKQPNANKLTVIINAVLSGCSFPVPQFEL